VRARQPDAVFVVPLATRETRLQFEAAIHRCQAADIPFRLLFGHAQDAVGAADVALVASGTATLEAALIKRPMVITYKIAKFSYWLMKRMAYLPYVGLPNVLAGRFVVPELLQDDATRKSSPKRWSSFTGQDGAGNRGDLWTSTATAPEYREKAGRRSSNA
jgi:lipid-A-disaccharide synthase